MRPDRRPNPDFLEERLRALPRPPVPAKLEARLLADIPTTLPRSRRQWREIVVLLGVSAAACLAFIIGLRGMRTSILTVEPRTTVHSVVNSNVESAPDATARLQTRDDLSEPQLPAFHWPLQDAPPVRASSLSADLFD